MEGADRFTEAHLRTMRSIVKEWRAMMAKNCFTLRLMQIRPNPMDCREWRWLERFQSTKISVRFSGEATGRR